MALGLALSALRTLRADAEWRGASALGLWRLVEELGLVAVFLKPDAAVTRALLG